MRTKKTTAILENFDQLPDNALVREPVVGMLFGGISHSTIWRYTKMGLLPTPQKISAGVTAWRVGDLRAALAAKAAA